MTHEQIVTLAHETANQVRNRYGEPGQPEGLIYWAICSAVNQVVREAAEIVDGYELPPKKLQDWTPNKNVPFSTSEISVAIRAKLGV